MVCVSPSRSNEDGSRECSEVIIDIWDSKSPESVTQPTDRGPSSVVAQWEVSRTVSLGKEQDRRAGKAVEQRNVQNEMVQSCWRRKVTGALTAIHWWLSGEG